ncbi:MAG: ATP-binding protein [Anaerolineae bacterium]|nr:ATP-binding protein [Anaerolineae bacterium]
MLTEASFSTVLNQVLQRLQAGSCEPDDLEALRCAITSGQIVLATGERAVALGGSAHDAIIVTGDNNIVQVFKGPDADAIRQIFQQFLNEAEDLFMRFATDRHLGQYIRTRDFQVVVREHSKEFVGRNFIFKSIDDLLASPDFTSGYIVISGEPGIGKTALIAQLVKRRAYVHHFNIATANIRSVRDFLANVCAQIIVRYDLKYRTLPDRATADSGFLLQLLAEAATPKNRPVVVLVDAIDEAEDVGLPSALNRLYLPQVLPEGVFFIVTTRPKADYRLLVDQRKDIYLDDQDPNNIADIIQYILNFIQLNTDRMEQRFSQWCVTKEEFVTIVTEKSEGNFMYLRYVLPDIRDGSLTVANIDDIRLLPQGLRDYYRRHWRSMKAQDVGKFEKYYQPVICILAVTREPVAIDKISEWTKLSPREIKEVIDEWREFLNVDVAHNGRQLYRLYHTSFQEFLRDEVELKPYHGIIVRTALEKIQW